MIIKNFENNRALKTEYLLPDITVVGGGISGVCAAITAARQGVKVVLVQDRPVLGGNASSEVRLWILGATSHLGNNNRWSREGGLIDEILLENLYRNKEGNPVILDTVIMDLVLAEKNITLLLNTQVFEIEKENDTTIQSVIGFCSQNSTMYHIKSPLFIDASGDGIVGFLSGASFRMGAEKKEEFGEGFAPDVEDYGELLGHTIYFYSKDVGYPVKYKAPDFALKNINQIPRFHKFNSNDYGCSLWWVEYGGRMDTIHDTEAIKFELWKVVYGIWNHIKNSGLFPESETLTLEWVGTIPGKRESRRFMGDYMLVQQDVIEQRHHADAVAHGGWAIDLHPADGIYSEKSGCTQWHSKGIYEIPYRCFYSKDINNLFFTGRAISASHVAFGSTRVMATCGAGGNAVGMAAATCAKEHLTPKDLLINGKIKNLQQQLIAEGQFIPGIVHDQTSNKAAAATIAVSSQFTLSSLTGNNEWHDLSWGTAQMIPLLQGKVPGMRFHARCKQATILEVELRISNKPSNFTPEKTLARKQVQLASTGDAYLDIDWGNINLSNDQYVYVCFEANNKVSLELSETRVSGILSLFRKENKKVSNYGRQDPPKDIGVDSFEFWTPMRRPEGKNLAFTLTSPTECFIAKNLTNGIYRPVTMPNAWVSDLNDSTPYINLKWSSKQQIKQVTIFFDPDHDHPMESSQMGHPEDIVAFCIRDYHISTNGKTVYKKEDNHLGMNKIIFNEAIITDELSVHLTKPSIHVPAAVFGIYIS